MITFESDYVEGAHPKILERLIETNMEQVSGYGFDKFSDSAKKRIQEAIGIDDAQITFLAGGTQTNQVVIDAVLQSYEGVVAADTGHINCHEAGAIEFTGHKVLAIPSHQGLMKAADLEKFLETFFKDGNHEHMVFPGMVYVTHPSEYGTLYTKQELSDISEVCHRYYLPLFLDGARLGYGLCSPTTDLDLKTLASLVDVFYIGGTKVGALIGEAVVFTKHNEPKHFQTIVKQHGALLAKGRLIALQFDTLFTDDLYFQISKGAIDLAMQIKKALLDKGYKLFLDSPTNQQFVILENDKMEELKKSIGFGFWETYDDTHTVVRFATSWATTQENVDYLISLL